MWWVKRDAKHKRSPTGPPAPRRKGGRERHYCFPAGTELVRECEAYLLGHLAEHIEASGSRVPAWAWTNLLAHASAVELRAESARTWPKTVPNREWRQARSHLAAAVLGRAGRTELAEIQRDVLVPLESELATKEELVGWGLQLWVASVETALARCDQSGSLGL